jgi:diguanylate cyclase (GGDEF)-like protein
LSGGIRYSASRARPAHLTRHDQYRLHQGSRAKGLASAVWYPIKIGDAVKGGRAMFASEEVESRTRTLEAALAAAQSQIRHLESLIETDALLDILNRRGFERELKRAIARVARYDGNAAIVFIDLDHFKSINDQFGHLAGDAVTETIVKNCRNSDVVARFGGDEFAVLLWNLSEGDARAKAHTFETRIASLQVCLATNSVSLGASAGVAMLKATDTPSEIIARADADMYSRKISKKTASRYQLAALPAAS